MTPKDASETARYDYIRREQNQIALDTPTPTRVYIPMTTAGLAQMRSAIETHVRSEAAVDNMFYQLQNPPKDPSGVELAARMFAKLAHSLVDDVKFMASAIKTRVEFEALQPQTTKQKAFSVLSAINDGASVFMASAKQSIQAYREEAKQGQADGLNPAPR